MKRVADTVKNCICDWNKCDSVITFNGTSPPPLKEQRKEEKAHVQTTLAFAMKNFK